MSETKPAPEGNKDHQNETRAKQRAECKEKVTPKKK